MLSYVVWFSWRLLHLFINVNLFSEFTKRGLPSCYD